MIQVNVPNFFCFAEILELTEIAEIQSKTDFFMADIFSYLTLEWPLEKFCNQPYIFLFPNIIHEIDLRLKFSEQKNIQMIQNM